MKPAARLAAPQGHLPEHARGTTDLDDACGDYEGAIGNLGCTRPGKCELEVFRVVAELHGKAGDDERVPPGRDRADVHATRPAQEEGQLLLRHEEKRAVREKVAGSSTWRTASRRRRRC